MDIDADSHRHHNHSHLPKTIHQSNLSSHAIEAAVKPSVSVFNPRLTQPRPAEDPLLVSEYSEEIFGYMRQMELKTLPNAKYILSQPGITWEMRRMLVDWLLSLHQKLRLLPETLFLTINLLDRFMSLKVVSVEKFQLVGITAMFIACKYEEIMVPSVQVMVHMVEGGYSSDEILKAEKFMLGLLKFGIGYNGPCSFLKRGLLAEKPLDVRCVLLAKYFCDVALLDHLFVAVGGSLIAASAIYLGKKILNNGDWTAEHVSLTGYSENQVVECAKALYNSVSLIGVDAGVYLKYADAKYSHVATYVKEFTLKNIAT
ncbi:cyclin-like protein [Obelidium mucronatum]|nr:cyclin-like protein [Obelidium mucronatum]